MEKLIKAANELLDFLEKYPHQYSVDISEYENNLRKEIKDSRPASRTPPAPGTPKHG